MKLVTDPQAQTGAVASASRMQAFYRKQFFRSMQELSYGRIVIEEPYRGDLASVGRSTEDGPMVSIMVHDPEFYKDVALRGSVGAGEAFTAGIWETTDLEGLIRIMLRNRDVLDGMEKGIARVGSFLLRRFDARNANTKTGSRRNIAAHYDLGNDFFAAFLDRTMTYSSGIFAHPDATLEEAQKTKLDRLCQKLDLQADDHVLEIGTGWGSFAIHAARDYGCRVTTTTISRRQFEEAQSRVRAAGLEDRIELLLTDYRDLTGRYDKLASIEMVEAVGDGFLDSWFGCCARLLKPNGIMAMQAITITDQHYDRALSEVDFIKRYIFPGSFIPSFTRLVQGATAGSDLRMIHMEDFGTHYAETLRRWNANLRSEHTRLRRDGHSPEFLRMWQYYLEYCAGGFAERFLGVAHLVFRRPDAESHAILGTLSHTPA